jgi:hypothetical protein
LLITQRIVINGAEVIGYIIILISSLISVFHTHNVDDYRIKNLEEEVALLRQKDVIIPKKKTIQDIMGIKNK